ncbi:hypothetical protein NBRC116188_14340 [Oceaniserpentilla sp. 4NH20-0058]|uniref:helix-turn-helix domain-containing protein n=1 Tax=Oceaniserpentilla sp. 4NH20-0058 TaxID=3127660 RepID=UPI0031064AAD
MEANSQQLRETLRLTRDLLDVQSEADLEYALEWFAKIIKCDSILVLNFRNNVQVTSLETNAAYHTQKTHGKCDQDSILENPLFQLAKSSFECIREDFKICLPPCGGLGTLHGEKDIENNSMTSLLMVTKDRSSLQSGNEITQFLLPHITSAISRYNRTKALNKNSHSGILSTRELDVLNWIGAGKSNWETAMILGISENTVKFHVSNICKKLNVRKRGHAIAKASQLNLITI